MTIEHITEILKKHSIEIGTDTNTYTVVPDDNFEKVAQALIDLIIQPNN